MDSLVATTPTPEQIIVFDQALDRYMSSRGEFQGDQWRHACHQSAKIAAAALNLIWPACRARVQRVQLLAYMAGAGAFVHIGWPDDPSAIEGKYPMHWAVCLGADLYDPTFWQLTKAKTPLDLPPEPFCYVPQLAKRMADPEAREEDGVVWMSSSGARGLRIGYGLVEREIPAVEARLLMGDADARRHASEVVQMYRQIRHPTTDERVEYS